MLSGFNTNFRHRGVLFHVQTEDSGIENPHVITHLFHGGNILASQKREYSDQLGSGNLASVVLSFLPSFQVKSDPRRTPAKLSSFSGSGSSSSRSVSATRRRAGQRTPASRWPAGWSLRRHR